MWHLCFFSFCGRIRRLCFCLKYLLWSPLVDWTCPEVLLKTCHHKHRRKIVRFMALPFPFIYFIGVLCVFWVFVESFAPSPSCFSCAPHGPDFPSIPVFRLSNASSPIPCVPPHLLCPHTCTTSSFFSPATFLVFSQPVSSSPVASVFPLVTLTCVSPHSSTCTLSPR